MDPSPANERELLLLQEGAALRTLARSLVHGDDVDDVVQSTHAAALGAPPATDRFLLPWLRVTLRNLALGSRRAGARRRAREQVVATSASLTAPSAAELALQAELVRDVGAAVHALDEPFRTAVLLRYWHGLLPDAIAERLGVPRNTVRSRLQRGLERLRTGLDRGYGDRERWQRALAPFAASPTAAIAATGTATLLFGWIMQGKTLSVVAATLAAAVVGTWWWQPVAPPRGTSATDVGATHVATTDGATDAIERVAAVGSVAAAAPAPVALPSRYHVLVRGRCIDERGAAVAGARIELRAETQLPLDASGANQTTSSGADGSFALALVPAVCSYQLGVGSEDLVGVQVRWDEVEPGHTYDVGDLVLQRGGGVTGRVVDETGAPLQGVRVAVGITRRAGSAAPGKPAPPETIETRTLVDGSFAVRGPLAPDDWVAAVRRPHEPHENAPSARFRIEAGVTTTGIELVCRASASSLRLQVVDERGAGIGGASIAWEAGFFAQAASADANGWFVLPRNARDQATQVRFDVSATGYEPVRTEPLAWGGEARVPLRAVAGTSIEVRAHDGRPVAAFAICLSRRIDEAAAGIRLAFSVALPRVPRDDGRVWLPGLPHGRYDVWVEPEAPGSAAFAASIVADAATSRHVLHAPAAGVRRVRVVDAAQRPIGGTVVELVQSRDDAPAGLATPVLSPRAATPVHALLLQHANTDAAGEIELNGAAGKPYTVRVLGPGHRPLAVPDVRLDDGLDALVIAVDVGATVSGTFGPPELLARLGPTAADVRSFQAFGERGAAIIASQRPIVVLRPVAGGKDFPENASDGAVQGDGTFRIDGVPPGTWRVFVRNRPIGPGSGSGVKSCTELAALRNLAAGEHRHIELDGSSMRPGSLRGLVLVDGQPHANAQVHVRFRRPGLTWGTIELAEGTPEPTKTDGDGRFAIEASPGEYGVQVELPAGEDGTAKLRNDHWVTVAAGAAADGTFELQRRTLRVRVLRADGSAEAGRKFSAMWDRAIESAGTTDTDGWLEIASVPAVAFELVTWPLAFADEKAQTDYIRAHPYPQWLDVLIRLGPLQLPPGQARAEVELRLAK